MNKSLSLLFLLCVGTALHAGQLGTMPVWISNATPTASLVLNNDDYAGEFDNNPNKFRINETSFGPNAVQQSIVNTERIIPTTQSGGTTEYAITIGGGYNDGDERPGVNLDSRFQVQLGFGTGGSFVRARDVAPLLRFDAPSLVSPLIPDFKPGPVYPTPFLRFLRHDGDTLIYQGSSTSGQFSMINFNNSAVFRLPLDIPDLPASVRNLYAAQDLASVAASELPFTVRVVPFVPERSAWLLGLWGALAAGNSLRTRRMSGRRRPSFERLEDRRVMAVDFASTFAVGGADSDSARDVAIDGAGNTYVVGKFGGTVDFDPGPGTYELTSVPANPTDFRNYFAAKYDSSSNLMWAQRFGSFDSYGRSAIALDSGGNAYVIGTFDGTADFGSTTLTSAGLSDAFLTKLDTNGSFIWTRQFGGADNETGHGMAVDSAGNVLVLAAVRPSYITDADILVAKIMPTGLKDWTTIVGASSSKKGNNSTGKAFGGGITVDAAGSVYVTGELRGTVDFDPGPGTTALSGLAYVMKLNPDGNLAWARAFTRASNAITNATVKPGDIAVDASGNVYSTGQYWLGVDFDPGTAKSQKFVLHSDAGVPYVSALNSSGNFLWAKGVQFVDGWNAGAESLALDGQGGLYVAGWFRGVYDFDPASGTFGLTSYSSDANDAFIWKLNTSGSFVWAGQMGGTGNDEARSLGVDASGNIYTVGLFNGTADFDPGPLAHSLISAGKGDMFLAKLTQTSLLSLGSSKAIVNSADLLAASIGSDIVAAEANAKRTRESARPHKRIDWTPAIDVALEEIDLSVSSAIAREIGLSIG